MQNMGWKLALIVFVIGLMVVSIFTREVRLGKDLQGGVSLVYQVNIPEGADAEQMILQVITVLKDRVNPQGQLDISIIPMGRDRIEIVMPLPNEEVTTLKEAYEDQINALTAEAVISEAAVDEAIASKDIASTFPAEPTTQRGLAVRRLQVAIGSLDRAAVELQTARDAGADSTTTNRLVQALADAEIELDDARTAMLSLSLDPARVQRLLRLPTERGRMRDPVTNRVLRDEQGNELQQDSQRQIALDQLRDEYPDLAPRIDLLVTAFDEYQSQKRGFDDPEDLKRLLRGAGVLEFRIAVRNSRPEGVAVQEMRDQLRDAGPSGTDSTVARWYPINDLKQWYETPVELELIETDPQSFFSGRDLIVERADQVYYILLYDLATKRLIHEDGSSWSVERAGQTVDQLGRPAVSFSLDDSGGAKMGRLTGSHVTEPMAIVLDDQVYSAPTIQSQISSNGIITGDYTEAELSYLIRVLAAGSLEARLSPEPISTITVGPSLGQDNLQRGKEAFIIAVIAVAIFMTLYYFFAGAVAAIGLAINGVVVFGLMMAWDATFTLPGLAGIVLTIGMAVDANVLIYERIREELFAGEYDLRGCVREGYRKALSTILDGNITNLIVCAVLYKTATTEVKGFAVTLAIGICGTLFTALFVTRQVYYWYTDFFKVQSLPMLATKLPAIHRALEPNINWIGMRKLCWIGSGAAMALSIVLMMGQGVDMFDTEFRGGVQATMLTKELSPEAPGEEAVRIQLPLEEVRSRLAGIAQNAPDPAAASGREERVRAMVMRELGNASVLTVGKVTQDPDSGSVSAAEFQIKVSNPRGLPVEDEGLAADVVVDLVIEEFDQELEVSPARDFDGAGGANFAQYTYQIDSANLGTVIGDPSVSENVRNEIGGVAVVVRNIEPPISAEEVSKRLNDMADQPDFAYATGWHTRVVGIGAPEGDLYRAHVVLITAENISYEVDELTLVDETLARPAWELVSAALERQTSLQQVSSYSSSVAHTLTANASVAVILSLLAILVYIWIRFGSLRYSAAAVVALVHDVTIALGLLALTALIGNTVIGSALLIDHFRIDLGVVAALLTIVGYSLNDTIVILDRIRENRGKMPLPSAEVVNRSINQTISRTLLTSGTTLIAVIIMYSEGGTGIRPFTFCLLVGIIVGTYSSVGIAAPLVFRGKGGSRPEPVVAPNPDPSTPPARSAAATA